MGLEIRLDRQEIISAKELVSQRKLDATTAQENLKESQEAYTSALLLYLGASDTSPVVGKAEEILETADSQRVDPGWLFRELDKIVEYVSYCADFVVLAKLGARPKEPEEVTSGSVTAQEYCKRALDIIKQDSYGSRHYISVAAGFLKKAAELAESSGSNEVIIYRWADSNLVFLFDQQRESWLAHY